MTEKFTHSSGNVFEDIGIQHAGEHAFKAGIALKLIRLIEERDLNQAEAAKLIGASQPDISNLKRGIVKGFTLDRLCNFVRKLDIDIQFTFKPRAMPRKRRVYNRDPRSHSPKRRTRAQS